MSFTTTAQQELRPPGNGLRWKWNATEVTPSVLQGLSPAVSRAGFRPPTPWLCNRGDRCNRPNHHKPNNRPNHGSQIRRSDLFSPQGPSPHRGAPVSSRRLHNR
ncbi:MAG: hypothetical protein ACKO2P_09600, partial [Planctomycetota bacterium]